MRSREGDIQAITKQIYVYCRSMDRMDVPLGCTVFHEDATADYGAAIFQGSGHGFVEWVTKGHGELYDHHSHQVTNVIINLDGDRAASESYVTATMRSSAKGQTKEFTARGRYIDCWSCRNGRWAIDARQYIHDFADERDINDAALPAMGRRDHSDLSYDVLTKVAPE
jgi:hypothetical protein